MTRTDVYTSHKRPAGRADHPAPVEYPIPVRAFIRSILLFLLAPLLVSMVSLVTVQVLSISAKEATDSSATGKQKLSLIEFYTLSNAIPKDLLELKNSVGQSHDIAALLDELPYIRKEIDQMDWDAKMALSNPNLSYHQLSSMESRLTRIKNRISKLNEPIESDIKQLQDWYQLWLDKDKELRGFKSSIAEHPAYGIPPAELDSLQESIDNAVTLIESRIKPILRVGKDIGHLQTKVYTISLTVSDLIDQKKKNEFQQTSPTIMSAEFYDRLDNHLVRQGWENVKLFSRYQRGYLQQTKLGVVLGLVGTGILALLVSLSRSLVNPSSRWYAFAARPIATAIFLSGAAFMFYDYFLPIGANLPPDWNTILLLPLMIAAVPLTKNIPAKSLQPQLPILKVLIVILALNMFLIDLGVPPPFLYLFVTIVSAGLLVYHLFLVTVGRKTNRSINRAWVSWLGVLFPLVVITAGIAGYGEFSAEIFMRVLSLIGFTMILLLVYYVLLGLLALGFKNFPVAIVRSNSTVIVNALAPLLILVTGIIWLAGMLELLWIYPTVSDALTALSSFNVAIGSLTVTPQLLMAVIIAGYITNLCAHGINAVLLQETLPRYNVEHGVQLSITRLISYAVLTIGVLIILRILGFGLGQITIIGGALGVGIGFGLQAIVNNFVSGLILLFERPIKVGDVIIVGEDSGEVKEMGLRATTVQTFDNAEIVIPNSELISKNVTNWTLGDKRVRIKVPVGVAYGADIETVLKILLSCAEENPTVLSTPAPQALFLSFGDSSLNSELRVWISDFNDRMRVLSELNQDIQSEFELANIEIPFPQRDLHIRSVDSNIPDILGNKVKKANP